MTDTATPTQRCDTTELLVDQCGCPKHRGGQTVDEQVLAHRAELLGTGRWIPAKFPGSCCRCNTSFGPGTAIQRWHLDVGETWRAECCS